MKIISATVVGVITGAAFLGAGAVPAFADTSAPKGGHTLAEIQASAVTKTAKRTTSLNSAIAKITANSSITASDKSTILGILNGDLAGMTTVAAKVAADTTAAQAASDYKTIFTDYRVYAVAIPQAHYAATADNLTTHAIPRLTDAQQKLSALLSGRDSSKSTPALQADLADMTTQLDKASSSLSGLASTALAVTPATYNSNHGVLTAVKASLTSARAALKQARSDAATILAALG
jgi:hypothetical protein